MAAPAKRAEEAVSMGQRADNALRDPDFPFRRVRSPVLSQWGRVRHGVIANPVPGVARTFGLTAKLRLP
jgi:hypothetical protein